MTSAERQQRINSSSREQALALVGGQLSEHGELDNWLVVRIHGTLITRHGLLFHDGDIAFAHPARGRPDMADFIVWSVLRQRLVGLHWHQHFEFAD